MSVLSMYGAIIHCTTASHTQDHPCLVSLLFIPLYIFLNSKLIKNPANLKKGAYRDGIKRKGDKIGMEHG